MPFAPDAGDLRQQLGVVNRWHTPGLDQSAFPPMLTVPFGPEGLNQTGLVMRASPAGMIDVPIDLQNIPSSTGFASAQPFSALYFQLWHRDLVGQSTSGLSNGLGTLIVP